MSRQAQKLQAGLERLGIAANESQVQQALQWLNLLERWNQAYNLTAIPRARRIAQLVWMSVAAIPYLHPTRVLDVGSGAGVPGIALAIFAPQFSYTLVDSCFKKIRFMRQAVLELNLSNVAVLHQNIEALPAERLYDTIISRAFTDMRRFFDATQCYGARQAHWLTFKGARSGAKEAALLLQEQIQCSTFPLAVPGLNVETVLLKIQTT